MRGARSAKWVAGAIVVAMAATACGSDDGGSSDSDASGGGVNPDGIFTVDAEEPQNPLLPTDTNEVIGGLIVKNVWASLVEFDDEGNIESQAAESIEPNEDSTEWTVTLKEGWTFHDGETVTAKSYVDAWNWGAHIDNNQKNSYWYSDIEGYDEVHPAEGEEPTADEMSGLEVVDDTTFTVKLSKGVSYFDYKLRYVPFNPYPSSFYDDPEAFGEAPIGQGPYEFKERQKDEHIELARFDDYKGDNKAQNGGVRLKNYNDPNAAYQDVLSNTLDVIRTVDPQNLPLFQDDLGDRAVVKPYNGTQSIVPVFYADDWKDSDPRVRQAISMAIDRETITSTVLNNQAVPSDSFVPPGVMGYEEGKGGSITEYDPEAAKKLFDEAGGIPSDSVTLQYNSGAGHENWTEAVCANLRQNLEIECVSDVKADFATDLNDRDNKKVKSMYRGGWAQDFPLNVNFMKDLYHSGSSANTGFFANEEVDRLFDEGDAAPTLEETVAAYSEAEDVLFEEMPAIPLWFQNVKGGHSENVSNVDFDLYNDPILTGVTVNE